MNRRDLTVAVANSLSNAIPQADCALVTEQIFAEIKKAVAGGDKVTVRGFGAFEPRRRPARKGTNPATGAAIQIPARRAVAFKVGKAFRDAVNQ